MARRVEFFCDYLSPYSYLANTQLAGLGVPVERRPISIGDVMKLVNNQPSPKCPPKSRYAGLDGKRWADRYGVPLGRNEKLWSAVVARTFDPRLLIRGALAAKALGVFDAYHDAMFDAVWGHPQDVASEAGRAEFLERQGLGGSGLWEKAADAAIEEVFRRDIQEATERGVFGAPTFFVDDEMFFGNDRLEFVRERLAQSAPEREAMV